MAYFFEMAKNGQKWPTSLKWPKMGFLIPPLKIDTLNAIAIACVDAKGTKLLLRPGYCKVVGCAKARGFLKKSLGLVISIPEKKAE